MRTLFSGKKFLATFTLAFIGLTSLSAPANAASFNDNDGDGIPNSWETNGYDYDNDGKIDLDFPAWGADPNHKDIFVEMDYMPDLMATQSELDAITQTFANYPIDNPDGRQGVNIHLDAGSRYAKYDLGGGEEIPYQVLRNETTVGQLRYDHSDPARDDVFHYMVFGDYYSDAPGSSGIAQINGRNFAVTLGPSYWGENVPSATYIGTFIHELGHNLGLLHGGDDNVNFKPNYFSIMNYRYQVKGVPLANGTVSFGYSTHQHDSVNERSLYEEGGFGPDSHGYLYDYRPDALADAPIDFNNDGQISSGPVAADLNNDGYLSTLHPHDDVANIRFQARGGDYRYSVTQPRAERNELTADQARDMNLLDEDAPAVNRW